MFINKLMERGLKDSVLALYYHRLRRPIINARLRRKYTHCKPNLPEAGDFNTRGNFFFDSNDLQRYRELFHVHYTREIHATLFIAEQICSHRFGWLTPNCPEFGEKIVWNSNFIDNRLWPSDFYMDLDYSGENRAGDVREVWELNRHQYFVTLGKAYMLSGDEKYALEFISQFRDWIHNNPTGYGINWLHAQETSLRMVSWIWAYFFFMDSPSFTDDLKKEFFIALYNHAEFTYLNLSRDIVTHNHLISEICGLAFYSILFPSVQNSVKWKKETLAIFESEVEKQIWEDGPSGELSTAYHFFVLDSFLQIMILCGLNNIELKDSTKVRIEKMLEYGMYIIKPDGSIPLLGDSDSGRAYRLCDLQPSDRRSYLSTGSVLFSRGDFKSLSGRYHEETFWLLSSKGFRDYCNIESKKPQQKSKIFTPAGIAVIRSGWESGDDYILFRTGPAALRKNVSTSHNHSDLLSFEFFSGNTSVFIDPGVYLYSREDKWRHYFRSAVCHNTIMIDGVDGVDVKASRFGIPNLPISVLEEAQFSELHAYVSASTCCYDNMGVRLRRSLVYMEQKYLLLIDSIKGTGVHDVELCFNAGNAEILKINEKIEMYHPETKEYFSIKIQEEQLVSVRIFDGWSAPRYGEKRKASVIRLTYRVELPSVIITQITGINSGDTKITSRLFNGSDISVSVSNMKWRDRIRINEDSKIYIEKG